jgi:hypothetical protein
MGLNVPSLSIGEGSLTWNTNERTLNLKMDGSDVYQQIGMEQYMPPVHNSTGSTITNGTVVGFGGADSHDGFYHMTVVPYIANGTMSPVYIVGIATEDIADGAHGLVTTFGMVRTLNTTGVAVGESWAMGDILYAHPTIAGKLTKVKPTAPNIVIPVAAVVRVDATLGEILVRPTIQQRLHYGRFTSDATQSATLINTGYPVTFNSTYINSGISVVSNSRVTVTNSGLYEFNFSLQLKSDRNGVANIWIWAKINGSDVPYSARKVTLSDKTVELVAAWSYMLSMTAGQYFELMFAVDDLTIQLHSPTSTAFCPATHSAMLNVSQINL